MGVKLSDPNKNCMTSLFRAICRQGGSVEMARCRHVKTSTMSTCRTISFSIAQIFFCSLAIDWDLVRKDQKADESVKPVEWAKPGTLQGYEMLASFIKNRIKIFDTKRNDPNVNGRKIS